LRTLYNPLVRLITISGLRARGYARKTIGSKNPEASRVDHRFSKKISRVLGIPLQTSEKGEDN